MQTFLIQRDTGGDTASEQWHTITAPDKYGACRLWLDQSGMKRDWLPMSVLVAHATPDNLWPNGNPRCVFQLSVTDAERKAVQS